MNKILELTNINYYYNKNKALCNFDFELNQNEIHALTGDHRSGKSTIAKILGGALKNQYGSIYLFDTKYNYITPKTAIQNKIGVVYQTPESIPNMTVFENIFVGRMPHFYISGKDKKYMKETCNNLFNFLNVEMDMNTPLKKLSKGQLQIVSIARVLSLGAEILVLDEISQLLTPNEMKDIYAICRKIKTSSKSIIYITSNIDEIFRIADRVTVIKDGYRSGTEKVETVDPSRLANLAYNMAYSDKGQEEKNRPLLFFTNHEKAILKDLPIGMVLLNVENKLSFLNTSAENILGLREHSDQELTPSSIFASLNNDDLEEVIQKIQDREDYIKEKIPTKHNSILSFKSIPLYDKNKNFNGTNIFIEDVSFESVTKEYLLRAEKIASTAELAAGVAHEINNPLGIIQNYIEILSLSINDEENLEQIEQIKIELSRIVEIVGSLLSFSRIQKSPLKKISICALLDEVTLLLGHKFKEKNIELIKDYKDSSLLITGYENKLKQLFMNLIVNSIEAVLSGGKIKIYMEKFQEYVEVVIADNGYGITDKVNTDIFKPFFSTKVTKMNTGLGLSICQHIAETHRGIITFESKPGSWTKFCVKLPIEN